MKHPIFTTLALAALFAAGCQTQKNKTTAVQDNVPAGADTAKLQTRLYVPAQAISADSVMLTFTVINHGSEPKRFCKWETPFEPRLGKYFDIQNAQGAEAPFKGAMARRIMPPPAEAYLTVAAHDSTTTTINLARNYTLQAGAYTIKYVGGGVSGLEAGNVVKVNVGR
ncbi:hypothetical protein [Mucilaginibacter sp. CSA2-8R]|uniref:hypothetical protein n=1 Tax=Mucilaginibacter sp. CSA2-8R TaxID=3141542 RepID=UPI00315DD7EE